MALTCYTPVLLITVMLCLWLSPLTLCIEIVTQPESVVMFNDSEADFTCETSNAPSFAWRVNGTFFNQLDASLRADLDTDQETVGDNELYTLTIPARVEYNGTVVQAVASVPLGAAEESDNAILMIQGLLAAVGDVNVVNGNDSILLSWSPPFSLDVTGMDPDIWYTVLISNVTDEHNPTVVPCTDCHNLTQPHYTFTTANPSPCHKYSFTVIPQNGAGEGNRSEPVEGHFVGVPIQVDGTGVEVDWTTVKGRQIEILTLPEFKDCIGRLPDTCVVHCESMLDECKSYRSVELVEQNSTLTVNASREELPNDCKWKVTIETINSNGTMNSTGTIRMSTFDVQDTYTSAVPGGVNVTSRFSDNAQGCFIALYSVSSDSDVFLALPDTSGPAIVTGLDTGNYTVRVYDLEDGLPGKRPAVEIEDVEVTEEGEDSTSIYSSSVLLNASIDNTTELKLTVHCVFKPNVNKDSACVVIWCKRNDGYLNASNYSMDEEFPITILVIEGEYSVAVFGEEGGVIDREPLMTKRVFFTSGTTQAPPSVANDLFHSVVPVVAGVAGGCAVLCLITITFIIARWGYRNGRNSELRSKAQPLVKQEMGCEDGGHRVELIFAETQKYMYASSPETPGVMAGHMQRDSQGMKYADIATTSKAANKPGSVETKVLYEEIDHKATKCKAHPEHVLYSELGPRPDGLPQPPASEKEATQYATIMHPNVPSPSTHRHPNAPSPGPSEVEHVPSENETTEAITGPLCTLEAVVSMLKPVAEKWKDFGLALKMSDDFLDEVFTNMTSDEDCLVKAMDNWVKYHEPSWEKLATALREIGENELALKCPKKEPAAQPSTPLSLPTSLSPMEESHTRVADGEVTLPSLTKGEFLSEPVVATQPSSDTHSSELVTTEQPTPPCSVFPDENSSERKAPKDEESNDEPTEDITPFSGCTNEMVYSTSVMVSLHVVYPGTETESSATERIWPSSESVCSKTVMVCSAAEGAYPTTECGTERVYPTAKIMPEQSTLQSIQPCFLYETPAHNGIFETADPDPDPDQDSGGTAFTISLFLKHSPHVYPHQYILSLAKVANYTEHSIRVSPTRGQQFPIVLPVFFPVWFLMWLGMWILTWLGMWFPMWLRMNAWNPAGQRETSKYCTADLPCDCTRIEGTYINIAKDDPIMRGKPPEWSRASPPLHSLSLQK